MKRKILKFLLSGSLFAAIVVAIVAITTPARACDTVTAAYGVQKTFDFCLFITDATVGAVKVENASHASGDTYLMIDEGNEANTTNGFVDEGSCYSITLTASELTGSRILLNIEDQGTKAWADKCLRILTYGNSSAYFGSAMAANITEIGGVAQSATDLKDFADTGYDPATHKVQGVVLTDTTTTLTNAPTAATTRRW